MQKGPQEVSVKDLLKGGFIGGQHGDLELDSS